MMIAGFLAAASFVSNAAMADGYGYRYGGGYGHGYGYSKGYYGGGHGYRGRGGHHGGHGAGKVLLGVGLGYLLFNGIHQSRRHRDYDDGYYDRPSRYRRDAYQEPQRYEPPPAASNVNSQFGGADCVQIREYQTTIIIGGEEKEAYGDACLQPDGAWLQGPPKVVPNY